MPRVHLRQDRGCWSNSYWQFKPLVAGKGKTINSLSYLRLIVENCWPLLLDTDIHPMDLESVYLKTTARMERELKRADLVKAASI